MTRPIVAAYCFPTWHRDARLDARKGSGWNEWELLRAAQPRFPGHRILRPAWGEYDEADPAWAAREIAIAADHGVDAFLYDCVLLWDIRNRAQWREDVDRVA